MNDPMKPPMQLDEENMDYWKIKHLNGHIPTESNPSGFEPDCPYCSPNTSTVSDISKLIEDEENPHLWADLMFGLGIRCRNCKKEVTRVHMTKMSNNQREALLHESCPEN